MPNLARPLALAVTLLAAAAPLAAETPVAIEVPPELRLSREEFFERYGEALGLGARDGFVKIAIQDSRTPGLQVLRLLQTLDGVPVDGGVYSLTLNAADGSVRSGLGRIVPGLAFDSRPQVSEEEALGAAREAVASELKVEEGSIVWARSEAALRVVRVPREVDERLHRLAWRAVLVASAPVAGGMLLEIDALDRRILSMRRPVLNAWVPSTATAPSLHDGPISFADEEDDETGWHRLHSTLSKTLDNSAAPSLGDISLAVDFEAPIDDFSEPDARIGASLHWAMLAANGYFGSRLGLACLDGAGYGPIGSLDVYYGSPFDGGGFDTLARRFSFREHPAAGPIVAPDVVAHELAHCAQQQVVWPLVGLASFGGEGAVLGESFSDALGEVVERELRGSNDWRFAGDYAPHAFRSLEQPGASLPNAGADTYGQPPWVALGPTDYNAGTYVDAGVQNFWFYLLAQGGSGSNDLGQTYAVAPVGLDLAAQILIRAEAEKIALDHPAARASTLLVAREMCGEYSTARREVWNGWWAVGVGVAEGKPPLPAETFSPSENQLGVEPWPAKLRWIADGAAVEDQWEVLVSKYPDFPSNQSTLRFDVTGFVPSGDGHSYGELSVPLASSTTYYWKVRRHQTGEEADHLGCFRPTHQFKTRSKRVTATSPITPRASNQKFHPWNLPFQWTALGGATGYEVEVALGPSFSALEMLFPSRAASTNSLELDVRVDRELWWRVRPVYQPRGAASAVPGDWTAPVRFVTNLPKVILLSPAHEADVYPWPVEFEWKPIVGADRFEFEFRRVRGGGGDPNGDAVTIPLPGNQTTYEHNVRADDWIIAYHWRVRVYGPDPPNSSGFPEQGTPAEDTFIVSSWQTEVEELDPNSPTCIDPDGGLTTLQFTGLPNATAYQVWVAATTCPHPANPTVACATHPEELLKEFPSTGADIETVEANTRYWELDSAVKTSWEVVAIGPQGLPGHLGYMTGGEYLLRPSVSDFEITQSQSVWRPDDLVPLRWESGLGPYGLYRVTIWSEMYCCGDEIHAAYDVSGASFGTITHALDLAAQGMGAGTWTVEVAPHTTLLNGAVSCSAPWGSNLEIVVEEEPEPIPEAPWVLPQYHGSIGAIFVVFGVSTGAETYDLEVFEGSTAGPIVGDFSWTAGQLWQVREEFELETGIDIPDDTWAGFLFGSLPPTDYFYHVRACNSAGCSEWSDWSEWGEGYPFPF
jgi:hypothetical protein